VATIVERVQDSKSSTGAFNVGYILGVGIAGSLVVGGSKCRGGVHSISPVRLRYAHSLTLGNTPKSYFIALLQRCLAPLPSRVVLPCCMKSAMRVPSGDLLAAARRAIGLRQAELARLAGIDASTLSRMEGSGSKPVHALSQNLEAVLEALRKAGVELPDENTIRLVKRRR
jgi:DNA-binding XRE family transcriptional regulator